MAAAKPHEELKRFFIQSAGRREALKKTPRLRVPNQEGKLRSLRRPARRPSHPHRSPPTRRPVRRLRIKPPKQRRPANPARHQKSPQPRLAAHHPKNRRIHPSRRNQILRKRRSRPPQDPDARIHRLTAQEAEVAAGIYQHTGAGPNANAIENAALRNLLGPDNVKNTLTRPSSKANPSAKPSAETPEQPPSGEGKRNIHYFRPHEAEILTGHPLRKSLTKVTQFATHSAPF